jgi:hypothetical protein
MEQQSLNPYFSINKKLIKDFKFGLKLPLLINEKGEIQGK